MFKVRPWGELDWLMNQFKKQDWTSILCSSFELRSTATSTWILQNEIIKENHLISITPHNHSFSDECKSLIKKNEKTIHENIDLKSIIKLDIDEELVKINNFITELEKKSASIIIDISTMPKRIFLFIVKRLLSFPEIKNVVVCYSKAEGYKEGRLTEDAQPPSALPGFARIDSTDSISTVVVGVGYMSFNIGDLLENSQNGSLKVLFPFPPGSPSYRRNWQLLEHLLPAIPQQTEIRRIHAMDLFAAYDWLVDVGKNSLQAIDMLPLGPKPHSLAMGLAQLALGDKTEILYSQPKIYRPDYSFGIKKCPTGNPDITAYCLRHNYKNII